MKQKGFEGSHGCQSLDHMKECVARGAGQVECDLFAALRKMSYSGFSERGSVDCASMSKRQPKRLMVRCRSELTQLFFLSLR